MEELMIKDEMGELKTQCTLCGLCKSSCPAYKVLIDESVSPRGRAVLLKSKVLSKHLYVCTLCKACENFCTVKDIDLVEKIRAAREHMVKNGQETEAGKRLVANINKTGSCVGKFDEVKGFDLWEC
ncbi:4Fe-4S dicluster domain-containing protein [Nanoarchaeota archaeon]